MSADYFATLRELLDHLAAHDPRRARFGARHHDYRLRPPLEEPRLAAIEAGLAVRLPDDYREHLLRAGDGGAGPYHGLMPFDHPIQRAIAPGDFDPDAPAWRGVVGLCHLGCGYVAFLVIGGPARGQVWVDLRAADDGVRPIADDFHRFYLGWIHALAHQQWLPGHVTPGRCALPHALTGYLQSIEEQQGIAPGTLPAEAVREALGRIPDGGIATASAGETPFFAPGDLVDLCVVCEQTAENLGMRRGQIVGGVEPLPSRRESVIPAG